MQVGIKKTQALALDAVMHRNFGAWPMDDSMSWGVGTIVPDPAHSSDDARHHLLNIVLDSMVVVSATEMHYSACTDGRVPVRLHNGEAVPVREQLVGADTMLVFHMAEVLGPRFYRDPTAPLADRLREVVAFLRDNGLIASTHIGCGAAAAYVAITKNLLRFTKNKQFTARQKQLLPEGIYSDELRAKINAGYRARLDKALYKDWSDQLVIDAVHSLSPDRAIAELNNDGRGVHGHVEEMIMRIQIADVAINELQIIARTHGREVFSVNDMRMRRLAGLIGRGQDEDYRLALMAAEDFTDAGHGTLAKNLPTYIITAV